MKQRLDLKVNDLGATELKNITEPVRVYSLEVSRPAEPKLSRRRAGQRHEALASRPHRASALIVAAIAGLLILAAAAAWYVLGGRFVKPAEAAHLSLVVLPFANLSGDPSRTISPTA